MIMALRYANSIEVKQFNKICFLKIPTCILKMISLSKEASANY